MPYSEDEFINVHNNPVGITFGYDYFEVVSQIRIIYLDYDDWMLLLEIDSLDCTFLRRLLVELVLDVLAGTLFLGGHDVASDGL